MHLGPAEPMWSCGGARNRPIRYRPLYGPWPDCYWTLSEPWAPCKRKQGKCHVGTVQKTQAGSTKKKGRIAGTATWAWLRLPAAVVVVAAPGLASCHLFALTRRKVPGRLGALRGLQPRLSPASARLHLSSSSRDPVSADASLPAASTSGCGEILLPLAPIPP